MALQVSVPNDSRLCTDQSGNLAQRRGCVSSPMKFRHWFFWLCKFSEPSRTCYNHLTPTISKWWESQHITTPLSDIEVGQSPTSIREFCSRPSSPIQVNVVHPAEQHWTSRGWTRAVGKKKRQAKKKAFFCKEIKQTMGDNLKEWDNHSK